MEVSVKKFLLLLGPALAGLAVSGVANAQATRTWVSGVGDDVNPCSRTAPCKTFAGAISKTAAGGIINALDPGGFGTVTITKSITIGTDPGLGGILNAATNGVVINAAATDIITLKGLSIDAPTNSASTGLNGVRILNAGTVNIYNSQIGGNQAAAPNGNGVILLNATGTVRLNIVDSTILANGSAAGSSGAGVQINPTGSGSAIVSIQDTAIMNNTRGLSVDTSGTTGNVKTAVKNSSVVGNSLAGVLLISNGAISTLSFTDSISSNNGGGLGVNGAGSKITFARSTISENTTGLVAVNGGVLISSGGNIVVDNVTQGAPTGTIPPI